MQKQQLEQLQLQQHANSTATANSTQVSVRRLCSFFFSPPLSHLVNSFPLPQQGRANTLDEANAQFAASALVTADQMLALKTKEELGLGGGVNGVLSPSGMKA